MFHILRYFTIYLLYLFPFYSVCHENVASVCKHRMQLFQRKMYDVRLRWALFYRRVWPLYVMHMKLNVQIAVEVIFEKVQLGFGDLRYVQLYTVHSYPYDRSFYSTKHRVYVAHHLLQSEVQRT